MYPRLKMPWITTGRFVKNRQGFFIAVIQRDIKEIDDADLCNERA